MFTYDITKIKMRKHGMEKQPHSNPNRETPGSYDFEQAEREFLEPLPDEITTPDKTTSLSTLEGEGTGVEQATDTPLSPMAARLRKAAERVAGALDRRAEAKDERKAERAEMIAKVKAIGVNALTAAREVGVVSAAAASLAVETSIVYTKETIRNTVVGIAAKARERKANRAMLSEAYAMNEAHTVTRQEAAYESYEGNIATTAAREAQEAAYESYEDNIAYTEAKEEALAINEQKKADQAAAFDSYGDNIKATEVREAQEAAYESYEENIKHSHVLETARRLNEDAQAARERKAARKARRQELRGKAIERIKVGGRHLRRLGRIGLLLAKRTGRAVSAGASAAREVWRNS